MTGSTTATTSTVPPPANVEVLTVGETSVKVGWGPTLPGELYGSNAKLRSLTINWGSSRDNHGPVTYSMTKNGKLIVHGITRLYNTVGFTRTVRTFRACVWAVSAIGRSGPQMCATFTGV